MAREYDMEPLAELCRESLKVTFGDRAHRWSGENEIDKYIRGNWPAMLVAQQDDRLAGFASLRDGKIDLVWIGMAFRNQGVGRELMDAVEQKISEEYPSISVECYVPDRQTIQFYEGRGYSIEREYTDGISGIEKVVMGRVLESNY